MGTAKSRVANDCDHYLYQGIVVSIRRPELPDTAKPAGGGITKLARDFQK